MIKQYFNKKSFAAGLLFLLAVIAINACKKVDDHYNEVANQPWVTTGEIRLGPNGTLSYNYPKAVLVGDTISIQGKIFVDEGGYIQMGNAKAVFAIKKKITSTDGSLIDQVRFIVTKDMGLGDLPVKAVAKGITISLPSINVRQYAGIPQRTDTTLYVDQVARFTPDNLNSYKPDNLAFLANSSIDANGNIWFDNPLGVFKVNGAAIENILHKGTTLNDASGTFTINRIIGSVISYDGNTLNFSAEVKDNADTLANYVFKLCRLNVANKAVTTLNRTLVTKQNTNTDGAPGAFEGAADKLHIVAMSLRTDANNVLYFNNAYIVPSPNNDMAFWYSYSISRGNNPLGPYIINDVCKVTTDNQVSSLFSLHDAYNPNNNPIFNVPGFKIQVTSDYKISPDGATAYVYDKTDGFSYSLLQYDLNKKLPLHSSGLYASYRFLSYDSNPASSYNNGAGGNFITVIGFLINFNGAYALQPLPNGNILLASGASIAALNNLDQTAYIFAGSELGLNGSPAPAQTQVTGKAKNVIFNGGSAGYLVFCGIDKNGTVYYVSSATGNDLTSPPLTFYKIYSKK